MTDATHEKGGLPLVPLLLRRLTGVVTRSPGTALFVIALFTILSLAVSARFLAFKTNRADLIDPDASFHQRWLDYVERFGDTADAVVVLEGESARPLQRAADAIGAALEAEPQLFHRVLYRIDPGRLKAKGLQYLSPADLQGLVAQIEASAPVLEGQWDQAGLEAYAQQLTLELTSGSLGETGAGKLAAAHRAERLADSLSRFLSEPADFVSPWPAPGGSSEFAHADEADRFSPQYLLNDGGTRAFVLATPVAAADSLSGSSESIDRMRAIIRAASDEFPELRISLTGLPILEADEMHRSQADMTRASVIAFVGVGIVLLLGFRGFRHPVLALATLAIAVAWSLGWTTLAIGHLNILSISFAAILIGLGIDYAIHYLARYLEHRHQQKALRPALKLTSIEVGTAIATSAVTTAAAFLSAKLTNFLGVAELGVIAAGGILLCAIATFSLLPALVAIADRKVKPRRLPTPFEGHGLRRLIDRRPWLTGLSSLAMVLAVGACSLRVENGEVTSRVKYDANLLKLQAEGIESVETLNRVFRDSDESLLFAVSIAESREEVRELRREFESLPAVGRIEEAASMLPEFPPERTQLLVQAIHARLNHIPQLSPPREVNPARIGVALENLYLQLREQSGPVAENAAAALDGALTRMDALPLESQVQVLSSYEQGMLMALREQLVAIAAISDPAPVSAADLPEPIRERFVSPQGDWLLKVHATSSLWDERPLDDFVHQVRSVDPDATGTPFQNFEAARQIRESYLSAAIYALLVIFVVLLIDSLERSTLRIALLAPCGVVLFAVLLLNEPGRSINPLWLACLYTAVAASIAALFDVRNVGYTLLAMLPPVGGGFLLSGFLGITGIDLNPANLIILPLILGIGVDYGVHVVHDYRHQSGVGYSMSPSTMNAIVLTSVTSMVGFGSLLGAAHRGLVSLGLVLLIGIGCCLFLSLITMPALLTVIGRRRGEAGEEESEADQHDILPLASSDRRRSA